MDSVHSRQGAMSSYPPECFKSSDWMYLNEGGLNVIFAYNGPMDESRFVGRVLRINKEIISSSNCSHEEHLAKFERRRKYAFELMRPLIGSTFIDSGLTVVVPGPFVAGLFRGCEARRPESRRKAFAIRVRDAEVPVTLCTDYTVLHSPRDVLSVPPPVVSEITIEIKPKWGFLPPLHAYTAPERSIKAHVCRYCMLQHLKLSKGKVTRVSDYCPLDLFSCEPVRVRRALDSLQACPQNNFRVYTRTPHGVKHIHTGVEEEVQAAFGGSTDELLGLLHRILLRAENAALLRRLARLQSTFDSFDIEGITYMCNHAPHAPDPGDVRRRLASPEWIADTVRHFDNALRECDRRPQTCMRDNLNLLPRECSRGRSWDELKAVCQSEQAVGDAVSRFLIAATAKDVSLLITVKRVQPLPAHTASEEKLSTLHFCPLLHTESMSCDFGASPRDQGACSSPSCRVPVCSHYLYRVAVVDLDPKRPEKLLRYDAEDRDITALFASRTLPSARDSKGDVA